MSLFLELIEPKAPLFDMAVEGRIKSKRTPSLVKNSGITRVRRKAATLRFARPGSASEYLP